MVSPLNSIESTWYTYLSRHPKQIAGDMLIKIYDVSTIYHSDGEPRKPAPGDSDPPFVS